MPTPCLAAAEAATVVEMTIYETRPLPCTVMLSLPLQPSHKHPAAPRLPPRCFTTKSMAHNLNCGENTYTPSCSPHGATFPSHFVSQNSFCSRSLLRAALSCGKYQEHGQPLLKPASCLRHSFGILTLLASRDSSAAAQQRQLVGHTRSASECASNFAFSMCSSLCRLFTLCLLVVIRHYYSCRKIVAVLCRKIVVREALLNPDTDPPIKCTFFG